MPFSIIKKHIGFLFFIVACSSLSLFAQSNSFQISYSSTLLSASDTSFNLHIEGASKEGDRSIFQFQKSEDVGAFNSQISSVENSVDIRRISHRENTLHTYRIDGEDASIYKKGRINFDVICSFKRIDSLPETIKLELLTVSVKGGDFANAISTIRINKSELRSFLQKTTSEAKKSAPSSEPPLSLFVVFLLSLGSGILAILTPCIYAMIPLTVSFFLKKSSSRRQAIKNSLYYSLSIILIFFIFGILFSSIFGPAFLNVIATNSVANIIFFLIFFAFALSFFGLFEIMLPGSWSTQASKLSNKTDFIGIFFMALTLVIVSFSCTGPIIGNLIVISARGSYMAPLVGILGFAIALAIPFFFFSIFPNKLEKISKSAPWLNTIKVVLGFLELALSLKFLSNADLALGTRLLDREVFLSLWIVIFFLLGLYLLGAIRFKYDTTTKNVYDLPYLGVGRLLFAMLSWSFAIYLLPGLWGAPLKGAASFLPPMGTQDYRITSCDSHTHISSSSAQEEVSPHKYMMQMQPFEPSIIREYNIPVYFDYDEALQASRKIDKPLMLDFTGINCINCRKMEAQVWSDPRVADLLRDSFIIASLYVDARNVDLNKEDFYTTKEGVVMENVGDKYAAFQIERFNANVQPYYFFLDESEERIINEGYGYDGSVDAFLTLLHTVLKKYHSIPHNE